MNIAMLAEKRLKEQGELASLIFEGREISNMEMNRAAKKLGNALKNLGVKRGDRVILQMPNCPEFLFKHPKISEAAVIGIKDDIYGENIKAFVALKPGQTAAPAEIIEYCRTKLTSFLVPKEVAFMKSLPKSLVGKVLKKELRKLQ